MIIPINDRATDTVVANRDRPAPFPDDSSSTVSAPENSGRFSGTGSSSIGFMGCGGGSGAGPLSRAMQGSWMTL